MSTYRNIHGRSIKAVATDPTAEVTEGEIWYNTASDTFKTVLVGEAWSSSAPVATARYSAGFGGPQTANFIATGAPGNPNATEEYNGSGWVNGGNVVQGRDGAVGAGTQTSGLLMGGVYPPPTYVGLTEEYDGSSWSEVTNLSQARGYANGGGIQTAAWMAGGRQGPPYSNPSQTEEYDGSSWTGGGALATNTRTGSFSGTQTTAWIVGGVGPDETTIRTIYQEYDGSTWTNGPNNPTAIRNSGGSGTPTAALAFGAQTPPAPDGVTTTFKYDGTTWAVSPATLGTARRSVSNGMGPSGTSAICVAGRNPSASALTEEYNVSANVITAAAWSSAPAVGTGRYLVGGAGATYNASVIFGGVTNPGSTYRAQTEEYNGTSWSEDGDMSTARFLPAKCIGTATAALAAGGYNGSTLSNSEQYNGSSWTAETAMPAANRNQSGFGIETAGVVAGGQGPAIWANVYEYDGSSWTTANSLPVAKEQMCGAGTETAGLVVCGRPPSGNVTTVEEFDGTNWASGGAYPTAHAGNIVAGTQTDAYQFTGYDSSPAPFGKTASYDGTSWRTMPSLATNISSSGGSTGQGSGSSQIQGAGSTPGTPSSTTSQEFNVETTALNVKTLTQS